MKIPRLVEVDEERKLVLVGKTAVRLAPKEYAVLLRLRAARGRVVSGDTLLKDIWGGGRFAGKKRWTVYQHVNRLSHKLLQALKGKRVVHTVLGFGYAYDEARP